MKPQHNQVTALGSGQTFQMEIFCIYWTVLFMTIILFTVD